MSTEKTILAITKTEGSGARTVADILVSHYGYTLYSVRDLLDTEYTKLNGAHSINQEQLKLLANDIRKEQGVHALVAPMFESILATVEAHTPFIIESLLCPAEIQYLMKVCKEHGIRLVLACIDAPAEMRLVRLQQRSNVKGIRDLEKLRETDRTLYFSERKRIYIPVNLAQVVEFEAYEKAVPEKEPYKVNVPRCISYVKRKARFQNYDGKADITAEKIHAYVMHA